MCNMVAGWLSRSKKEAFVDLVWWVLDVGERYILYNMTALHRLFEPTSYTIKIETGAHRLIFFMEFYYYGEHVSNLFFFN